MSMIMSLLRVTPEQSARLAADPTLLEGTCHIASLMEFGEQTQQQILTELSAYTNSEAFAFSGAGDDNAKTLEDSAKRASTLGIEPAFCLQKEWHMLHFLLNGTGDVVEGPGGALFAGEEIGGDRGYGHARLLGYQATAAFADIVTSLSVADLLSRVDIQAMDDQQIYAAPFPDDEDEPAELEQAISAYFPRLQSYLSDAKARGDGLLIWIC